MAAAKKCFKHESGREKINDMELAMIWLQVLHDFCEGRSDEMLWSETALFIFRLVERAMKKMTNPFAQKMLADKIAKYKLRVA